MSTTPVTLVAAEQRPTLDLLRLALPMIGISVSRMLMGFIDFTMVSWLDDTAAVAAISPATLLIFAIGCAGMGIAQSVQTFVSQADGRGEPWRCGAYAWQTAYIALIALLATAPIVLTVEDWFGRVAAFADHPTAVRDQEIAYTRIALWSVAPAVLCMGLENFFNGIKRPKVGLAAILASLATNAFGNWVLIFGNLGFPRMGIAGAALATVIGWLVRAAVLAAALGSSEIDHRFQTHRSWRPDGAKLRELLRVGVPISFQWLVDIGAWVVFLLILLPPFGTEAMAASNIAIQYMHLSFMPALGIGMALTTQVGNAIGAGRPDEAVFRVRIARRLIVGYMGLMAFLFASAGGPLARVFSADDAVIATAALVMIWMAVFQFSDAVCIVYSFGLRGAGDTRVPALLVGACCWAIFVAGGIATTRFAPDWGVHGPWSMCTLYIVVLGVLLWWRFRSQAWRDIRLFEHEAPRPVEA